jgi:hypothetical protein
MRKTVIEAGDILLLLAPQDAANDVIEWLDCLPLADRGVAVTENSKVWLAIGLFAGAVALASFGIVYLPIALGLVVVALWSWPMFWPRSFRFPNFTPTSNGPWSCCSAR